MNTRALTLIALGLLFALLPRSAGAEARQGQDFLAGNGTAGPYTLSWKNVLPDTESVRLGDVPLVWGMDYTFDPVAGTLTFTHAIPAHSAAIVRYGYDTAQATPQGGGISQPLSMALSANVSLNAQFAHAVVDGAKPGALGLGLAGGWQGARESKFATRVLFAPALAGADAAAAPNGLARLGLSASGQTQAGRAIQLGFGLSRAGAGVGSLGGGDWQAGAQKMTLNGTVMPAPLAQATFGYTQTDAVTPGASGAAPARTQASAALTVTPTPTLRLQTTLAQTTGGGVGPAQNVGVIASLAAGKSLALTAGLARRRDALGDTRTTSVGAKAQPWKYLQVSGGYRWRALTPGSPAAADPLDSGNASVTLTPLSSLHLVGTYTQNPDDGAGGPQRLARRGLSLETRLGVLSLSGGYDWSSRCTTATATPIDDTSLHLGVGLRFSADTQLTGDCKQYLPGTLDPGAADAYSLGLTRRLGDTFDLSLSGIMQRPVGPGTAPNNVTAAASLGMKF